LYKAIFFLESGVYLSPDAKKPLSKSANSKGLLNQSTTYFMEVHRMNITAANITPVNKVLSTRPEDLISPSAAQKLVGITATEWHYARRYRIDTNDFPINYGVGNGRYALFSASEVTEFFNRFKK
ncbi:hypothetical protein NL588_004245, partial [Salmonella enterica]|nr:hypothetical protein [Salmonella enterica]EIP7506326.1 hypothetical protein [Salmonella enterica]EIQ5607591.1 hypothetical protein [Salmonella enterica]EJL0565856.1 hypothetical protein [Salmonella enterica]